MTMRGRLTAVLTLVFSSSLALPTLAADAKPAPAKGADGKDSRSIDNDADNVRGLSKYMETIVKGAGRFVAKDYPAALDVYRGAIPLSPKNPLAPYLVAETQIAMGSLAEAEASLKQAESLADDRTAAVRAKVLFLTADLKERQKKWDDAKTAWQAYSDFAQKHTEVASVQSATSRIQAIDDMLKQDKAYEAVRQRIAQEKGGAAPAPAPTGGTGSTALPKK